MLTERPITFENKEIVRKINIGVDLDDTVVDYGVLYFRAIKMALKHDLLKKHKSFSVKVRELPEIASSPEAQKFITELVGRQFFYKIAKPIPGAIETLNHWKNQGHEIWFITARWPNLAQVTFEWMNKHGIGWAIERTFFKQNPAQHSGEYKNNVCQKCGFEVFIEDQPDVLNAVVQSSIRLKIGLKKPWNIEGYQEGQNSYSLVDNWKQIAEKIKALTTP